MDERGSNFGGSVSVLDAGVDVFGRGCRVLWVGRERCTGMRRKRFRWCSVSVLR